MLDFPQLRQAFDYDCGSVVLEAVLAYYGVELREDKIIHLAKTDKQTGTFIQDIISVVESFHLKTSAKAMTLDELKEYIDGGIPVILVLQAWTESKHVNWKKDWDDGHYVVAIGYDKTKIYFEDPSSFERTYLTFAELRDRWHDVDGKTKKYYNYGIAVYGKRPKFSDHQVIHMD